jgi:hypothetical protein
LNQAGFPTPRGRKVGLFFLGMVSLSGGKVSCATLSAAARRRAVAANALMYTHFWEIAQEQRLGEDRYRHGQEHVGGGETGILA